MKKKKLIILIVPLIAMIFAFMQHYNLVYNFDRIVMDYTYQNVGDLDTRIKIIKIDEKSLERYGAFGSWSRQIYADLVNLLTDNGKPYLIGFDILFTGELDKKGDQAFVDACKKNDNVVVVNNIVLTDKLLKENNLIVGVDSMHVERIEQPYSALKDVTKQGFSNAILDNDGMIRKSLLSVPYNNFYYDSFATMISKSYTRSLGTTITYPKTDDNNVFGFSYTCQSHAYEEVSLVDVLDGKVDIRSFKNSVVLIGAHAPGMQDAYSVPIEYGKQMYGVEIHANIIEALLSHNTVLEINDFLFSLIIFCISIVSCILVYKINLWVGGIVLLLFNVMYLFVAQVLYNQGLELPIVMVPISCFSIYLIGVFGNYFIELRKRKKTIEAFKRYVAPQVVDQLFDKKDISFDFSGILKDIAVLFVDIRGFTSLSEKLDPTEVVEVLNLYFNLTSSVIFDNLGTLDKFIGDATMAVFNSPFDLDDYVYRAVKTAYQISQGNEELSNYIEQKYGISIGFGIGVHCGPAVIGNIGSEKRLDFTAIGDTVNVASRLESRATAGQILVSEEVVKRLNDRIKVNQLGEFSLKGKSHETMIYEVVDLQEEGLN